MIGSALPHMLPISFNQKPKTEQHVHVEGTVDRKLVKKFAERNNLQALFSMLEPFLYQFGVKDFLQFLTAYDLVSIFINTEIDIEDMIYDYLRRSHHAGVAHVDLTCSYDHAQANRQIFCLPKSDDAKTDFDRLVDEANKMLMQLPARSNLSFKQYIDAVSRGITRARNDFGINANITMVLLRHEPVEKALSLLDLIAAYPHPDVTAIGMAGDEEHNPASKFHDCFIRAKKMGLHVTSHVGEHTDPSFITADLDTLGLQRIGHGTTAIRSPEVMAKLWRLGNPARYFKKLHTDHIIVLNETTQILLDALEKRGLFANEADEALLIKGLTTALEAAQEENTINANEFNQTLQYLFQPLTLEVCPTSNLLLLPDINDLRHDHPLPQFIAAEIPVSINSDDPLFWSNRVNGAHFSAADFTPSEYGCDVGPEWDKVQSLFSLTEEQMHKIYKDSVKSMFCNREEKRMLLARGELYYAFKATDAAVLAAQNHTMSDALKAYEAAPSDETLAFFLEKVADYSELGETNWSKCADTLQKAHYHFSDTFTLFMQHKEAKLSAFVSTKDEVVRKRVSALEVK